ncbi:hypothetical protein Cylst_2561 [Cylindrospermum stagnale PCC 7417]|uniref:Uncharacterized protein n=1 Tax=Cylindrospermum stagnale PCC 7417 TaxID=56107 RepID=K9WZ23_9NOST|nr:hypothetical protein [Cylindrospermum stagnale]AFZ24767.1 hypothetical protein Cylst_2561 [Cylindrospermum stagnale PCC 7417]
MTVRAKFTCQVNLKEAGTQIATVVFSPVTTNPPTQENLTFWKATPSGQITLQIDNASAASQFEVGADYYVDFTAAQPIDEDTAIWNQ